VIFILLFLFIFGVCFGSFINVLIYRLPEDISITGRSFCPKCKKKINWVNNIPLLSYFILGGKCKYCRKRISLIYPIVEAITGILFVVTFYSSTGMVDLVIKLIILCILIPIFFIDIKHQIIPDSLIYFGYIVTLIYLITLNPLGFYVHIFSGFSMALILLSLHLATRGRGMGLGDVKFALFAGTFLGFPGSIIFIYLAFIAGAIIGSVLILIRLGKFGKHIAFGPFLAMSFWVTMLWGEQIWNTVSTILP
jgi:prepilin signal peptidase PulO-like enzyme (type II secretory pathway)